MKKTKVQVGDIFKIPLVDDKFMVGQVVAPAYDKSLKLAHIIFFEGLYDNNHYPVVEDVINNNIIATVITFTNRIKNNRWERIGHKNNPDTSVIWAYKSSTLDGYIIMDLFGAIQRKINIEEAEALPFMSTSSEELVIDKLKALNNLPNELKLTSKDIDEIKPAPKHLSSDYLFGKYK